jgi:hypothetical protein
MSSPIRPSAAADKNAVADATSQTKVKRAATRAPSLKAVAQEKIDQTPAPQAPKINPEIDAKLDAFIQKEKPLFDHYTKIIAENPQRAVRMLMLNKMQQSEYRQRQQQTTVERLKQWVEARPEISERISAQIAKLPEDKRQGAFVNIANRAVIAESTRQSSGQRV